MNTDRQPIQKTKERKIQKYREPEKELIFIYYFNLHFLFKFALIMQTKTRR